MNPEVWFTLGNVLAMPFWLLMIFAPHWRVTQRVMATHWIAVPVALTYALQVMPGVAQLLPMLANPQLSAISSLLGTPPGSAIAWAHFLAFDLLVGRWVYQDSRARGISAWLSGPVLFFVLMLGPIGFVLHMLLRGRWHRAAKT